MKTITCEKKLLKYEICLTILKLRFLFCRDTKSCKNLQNPWKLYDHTILLK